MKYRATTYRARNGWKCKLFVKFIFWIPIEYSGWAGGQEFDDDLSYLITEKIKALKDYYGDKLEIVDNRPNNLRVHRYG